MMPTAWRRISYVLAASAVAAAGAFWGADATRALVDLRLYSVSAGAYTMGFVAIGAAAVGRESGTRRLDSSIVLTAMLLAGLCLVVIGFRYTYGHDVETGQRASGVGRVLLLAALAVAVATRPLPRGPAKAGAIASVVVGVGLVVAAVAVAWLNFDAQRFTGAFKVFAWFSLAEAFALVAAALALGRAPADRS